MKMSHRKHGELGTTSVRRSSMSSLPNLRVSDSEGYKNERRLHLKASRSGKRAAVTKTISQLNTIDHLNTREAKTLLSKLDDQFESFQEAHGFYEDLISRDSERIEAHTYYCRVEKNVQDCKKIVKTWLDATEAQLAVNPEDSVSQTQSQGSLTSSKGVNWVLTKAEAERKALEVKLQAVEQERALKAKLANLEREAEEEELRISAIRRQREEERKRLEADQELLKLRTEIKQLHVKCQSLEGARSQICSRHGNPSCSVSRSQENHTDLGDITKVLANALSLNRLPPPKPTVFSGDTLKYVEWKSSFRSLIESKALSATEKMFYLREALSGPARRAVEGLFYRETEDAYAQAWAVLEERYGNPFYIKKAYRDKILKWPKIGNKDVYALRDFCDFLGAVDDAMPHVLGLEILNDCEENKKILEKLPEWIVKRWSRVVYESIESEASYPNFHKFVQFLKQEVKVACNPLCSPYLLKTDKESSSRQGRTLAMNIEEGREGTAWTDQRAKIAKKGYSSSHFTSSSKQTSESESRNKLPCFYCQDKNHAIGRCSKFALKTVSERKEFVQSNHLCFGCLKGGHFSSTCRQRHICAICKKRHPTCLHVNRRKKPPEADTKVKGEEPKSVSIATSNTIVRGCMTSSMVPVWVSSKSDPRRERLTYALLDTQSDSSFILDDLGQQYEENAEKVKLKISTMTSTGTEFTCKRISELQVRGMNSNITVDLPPVYTREFIPAERSHIPTRETALMWPHLQEIAHEMPTLQSCDVGLLIGYNCPFALTPQDVISGCETEPFAQKTVLGWSIIGISSPAMEQRSGFCNRVTIKEVPVMSPKEVLNALESDFSERQDSDKKVSQEDLNFIKLLNEEIHMNSSGYTEMPLPLKDPNITLPNNRKLAAVRLECLKRKFSRNAKYAEDYKKFMDDTLARGEAEPVRNSGVTGRVNYIPHHGVYHHRKKKIRVVFDCSAKFRGVSLNDMLLKGPELNNLLVGVLCRFRKQKVGIMCDIEKMFYQFSVNDEDRDLLRFLWWENGDTHREPQEYRMTRHLFGAASSPGCANFGLKFLADKLQDEYPNAARFIKSHFYVDDGLVSVSTVSEGVALIKETQELCNKGRLHLHKFASNSSELMSHLSATDKTTVKSLDLEDNHLERALGIQWCLEDDVFSFSSAHLDRPATRRGILSSVASVFDPLGFLAPYVLIGKRVLQDMCRRSIGWDDDIPKDLKPTWETWKDDLLKLNTVKIPRCVYPYNAYNPSLEIHHFADASNVGYGICSYLRFIDTKEIHCTLVFAKSRVTATRVLTIPRLELTAAMVAVKASTLLRREFQYDDFEEHFWTDSMVVLGYIQNESRRFHTFVANRVEMIRSKTKIEQWHYIPSYQNPADIASRGCSIMELQQSEWFRGPDFLWQEGIPDFGSPEVNLNVGDPEVKTSCVLTTSRSTSLVQKIEKFSSWKTICKAYARLIRRACGGKDVKLRTAAERAKAQTLLIKMAQQAEFMDVFKNLNSGQEIPRYHALFNLDPVIMDGVLRVGGRLRKDTAPLEVKHPLILPKDAHLTKLIIAYVHESTGHSGKGITVNELRRCGFWVIGGTRTVSSFIHKCVECRRKRRPVVEQRMADLPTERLDASPPFTHVGMDCFGPITVREGRKEQKRYGLIFTCKCSRAIHIETLDDMTTDTFINGLRCFIALRGAVSTLHSDQGSNFIGAAGELKETLKEMDAAKIQNYLADQQCSFEFIPPHAPHFGGLWERQIKTVKGILSLTIKQAAGRLDTSSLRTLLYEVSYIVNNRPLTTNCLNDPVSLEPLTPNHILTMKSKTALPPPGSFVKPDLYIQKRWRRVQYLCQQFWSRWRNEYISSIQLRRKWHKERPNLKNGDVVLLKEEDSPRNKWPLARVVEVIPSNDGLVRKVRIKMPAPLDSKGKPSAKCSILERPVNKLVLLIEQ